ncbi:MAG: hypothetical protein IJ849_01365 [Selenomonadaceae bacterium]|nr:hypothetical protein [Selenomonadaceae bacterium]
MKIYEDKRGWRYKVMPDLAGRFRTRYHKPDKKADAGWKSCNNFKPHKTEAEAQADLDTWAKVKGLKEVFI